MNDIEKVCHEINEMYFPPSTLAVGKIVKHPDGRTVKIKSGCYRDPIYNRVSNWWTWNELLPDGLLGPDESGYGWRNKT